MKFPLKIPTWTDGVWSHTEFQTRKELIEFLLPLFLKPGSKHPDGSRLFDKTAWEFNSQARKFESLGYYCEFPENTKDSISYWETEKEKCRNGVIFKSGDKTWYLTRYYYMWVNFLPLYDKIERTYKMATVYDTQYYLALYEALAELHYKHAALVKKRQIASSYFHAGVLINQLWFEEGPTLKMGASDKRYVDEQGTWEYLEADRNWLNTHTAWYREMNPGGVGKWQQQHEETHNGKTTKKGNKGRVIALTFERKVNNGVGGDCRVFFYEEAGIAKTLDKTYNYLRPAMRFGMVSTGIFIAAGSVGELTECEPLKKLITDPDNNEIYSIESDLLDGNGTIGRTGLFIPEQWSMLPYIDEFGNSLVEEALAALEDLYEDYRRSKDPGDYQFEISQRPRNIAEAFAFRGESEFPSHLLSAQRRRIEEREYPKEYLDIELDEKGKPKFKNSSRNPISDFPISPKTVDKRGCVVVWERPVKDPPWGAYYGSIDPVEKGKTRTSESLCSIYIHKTAFETRRINDMDELEVVSETPGIVAAWCGRFDNPDDTNNYLQWIVQMYNAWTTVENNVSTFITHMIGRNLQRYLVPTNQMIFKADLRADADMSGYGWRNTGSIFRDNMLQYLKDHIRTVSSQEFTKDGSKVVKTVLGIEEIRDIMLITEMERYRAGLNVDRLVAYTALRVLIALQEAHRTRVVVDKTKEKKDDKSKFAKLQPSPFRHMGGSGTQGTKPMRRNPFKHMR